MSIHGKNTYLAIGATPTDISTYLDSVDFTRSKDVHDDTTFGNNSHTKRGGLLNGTVSISGMYDTTATVGPDAVIKAALLDEDPVDFEYGPEGDAAGKVSETGLMVVSDYAVSSPVADLVKFTATLEISGDVTSGTFSA